MDTITPKLNPYISQGKLNNEFIRGNQNKKVDLKTLNIVDKQGNKAVYREKKIFNRILPIYLTRYSLLSQNLPIPGIVPTDNTTKDITDSNKANHFIESFMLDIDFKKLYKRAIAYADVYGIVWIKTGLDVSGGNLIAEAATKTETSSGTLEIREGRPFIDICPMYEIFPDNLYAESMNDIHELVHRRPFPVEYIRKRWGYKAEKESIIDCKLAAYPQYNDLSQSLNGEIEYAYIYEYYKKPDALYPEGRYTIVCNEQIIYDGVLPYKNVSNGQRCIPFDFFNMQSIPNYLIGVTVYSQLIPIQETFNSIKNRYLEYVNHIAIGQLYIWEGSLVNKNNVSTQPGKMIELKRNSRAPEVVQKEKLSQEFISYLKQLEEDMLITAGLSQMTAFGTAKSNYRTDGVVDKIAESDENKLVNALDNISDCLIQVFKKIIYLEKQRVMNLKDMLKGATKTFDDYILKYNLGDVDAEQITIVNRDFLMHSDQVFDKKLTQIQAAGLYAPQNALSYTAKVQFLKAIKANYLVDTLDPMERATHDLCTDEHRKFVEASESPVVEAYHQHKAHIAEHELFRISPEVRRMQETSPKEYEVLQEKISKHIEEHKAALQNSPQEDIYANAKAVLGTTSNRQGSKY